jgi:hypothetical protein
MSLKNLARFNYVFDESGAESIMVIGKSQFHHSDPPKQEKTPIRALPLFSCAAVLLSIS